MNDTFELKEKPKKGIFGDFFTRVVNIDLDHLSPSTVNSFITDRYGFYMRKVKGIPFEGNQYTARGRAVENAINKWLENTLLTEDQIVEIATKGFATELALTGQSEFEAMDVADSIEGLTRLAYRFYSDLFEDKEVSSQKRIDHHIKDVTTKFLGYTDYISEGMVRDCKVTSRSPSALSQSYIIQGSYYRDALKCNVVFDFFVANKKPVQKSIILTDDQYIHGMSYLTRAAQAIEQLFYETDPSEIIRLMSFPDLSAMYNQSERAAAAKEWKIVL